MAAQMVGFIAAKMLGSVVAQDAKIGYGPYVSLAMTSVCFGLEDDVFVSFVIVEAVITLNEFDNARTLSMESMDSVDSPASEDS